MELFFQAKGDGFFGFFPFCFLLAILFIIYLSLGTIESQPGKH